MKRLFPFAAMVGLLFVRSVVYVRGSPIVLPKSFRLLAIIYAFVIASSANARDALVPLQECPKVASHETCIVGALSSSRSRGDASILHKATPSNVIKLFLLKGRLNEGATKNYALKFIQAQDDYFADTNHSASIAMLIPTGTAPLILFTDRGRLEVVSKNLRPEQIPNVVILDDREWRVLARYYDCLDLSFLTAPRPAKIWDEGRRRCVAIDAGSGEAEHNRSVSCARPATVECGTIPGGLEPEVVGLQRLKSAIRDLSLDLHPIDEFGIGLAFGGDGWVVVPYRVPGTHLIVVYGYCGDCE